jgi:predicted 3-demethylubiquinone-9 3-methyltransferase (glyoxalase superfamily)
MEEYTSMTPKNTICLWFEKDALDAARVLRSDLSGQ